MNLYEESLKNAIEDAARWVGSGELEVDHFTSEEGTGKPGWYACEYIEGYGSIPIERNLYDEKPLISDDVVEKYKVNVYKVFDICKVAYCG